MRKILIHKRVWLLVLFSAIGITLCLGLSISSAQNSPRGRPRAATAPASTEAQQKADVNTLIPTSARPTPIVIEKTTDTLTERFERMITLDVREMNAIDVIKFLAIKGDFTFPYEDQLLTGCFAHAYSLPV